MTLPPLPLIDGPNGQKCFFIDNSTVEWWNTCHRGGQYSRLDKRVPAIQKSSLNFGSAGHLVWEHRYRSCGSEAPDILVEEEQKNLLEKFFQENPVAEDDWRNLNWAITVLVQKYNKKYSKEPFSLIVAEEDIPGVAKKGEPLVELPFALKLFDYPSSTIFGPNTFIPVYYCGRIDLPVIWDSRLVIKDHKTTSVLGDNYIADQRVSPQYFGYCWAFEELTHRPVDQFCINAVRVKEAPQYVSGIGKRGKITAEQWWEESFHRHREFIYRWQLVEWKNNVIDLTEEFFWHYFRGYFPLEKKWCVGKYGRCNYYNVCNDIPPESRHLILQGSDFMENTWSPLKQPSQSLQ